MNELLITPLMEQQMFDDWCPYTGNPDPRTVWSAAIQAVNGFHLTALQPKEPEQSMQVTDEENEQFSRDVSNFKGADPEATKYALETFLRNRALVQPEQEPVAWPKPMEQPPLYADEDPSEQARAFRYRAGWNDCLEKCKQAAAHGIKD